MATVGALVFNMVHRQRYPEQTVASAEALAHQIVSLFMNGARPLPGGDPDLALEPK